MIKPVRSFSSLFSLLSKKICFGLGFLMFAMVSTSQPPQRGLVPGSSIVKLLSFSGTLQSDNSISLRWSTGAGLNLKHFVVEKSFDGSLFKDHDIIYPDDSSSEIHNYQSGDNLIPDAVPVIFYRLRIVDNEGGIKLSEIRSIRTATPTVMDLALRIYPNPLKEELRVVIPTSWLKKTIVFEILNINGTLMKRINTLAMSGIENLSLSNLSPAIYTLKATCQGQTVSQRIIKE